MSKMDRMLNSKREKETIYEIYRACRLCGAGAGYKMPIIQNVVDLDDTDVELKQKIRECVQIEVHQDDKMPPLICELCVDKVNDFYEFLEMCRQTNKKTRLRLGLPPQSMPRGAPDAGECILGLTEPVYVNEDSDGEPLAKHKKTQNKVKVKKEPEVKVESRSTDFRWSEGRSTRFKSSKRSPTPPRTTRSKQNIKDDNQNKSSRTSSKQSPKTTPKPILKKESKTEDTSLLTPRLKRSRDKEPVKLETPTKKVKISIKPLELTSKSTSSPKSSPRPARHAKSPKISPKSNPKRPPSPPRSIKCSVCDFASKTPQAMTNHMKAHSVTFTSLRMACNPCGLWFSTADEASSHHKHHKSKSKPYNCRRCTADFVNLSAYEDHFDNNQCIPLNEVPDVKCEKCWRLFPTNKLLKDHKCLGEDNRPGGKCNRCSRPYTLLKNLKKHESTCTARKRGELIVDPVLLSKLKPIQVRVSRCDPLLTNIKQEHYDVSSVTADFGLDKNCYYPYISSVSSLRIKSEFDGMVSIKDEIKDEFCSEEYVHWDSEDSESEEEISTLSLTPLIKKKKVDSLATLTLKTLFSQKCLGRVPRKRRRVKTEKNMFDSLLNETEDDVTRDINNIIDNLGDDNDFDDEKVPSKSTDNQSKDEESKGDDSAEKGYEAKTDDVTGKNDEESSKIDKSDGNSGADIKSAEKNDDVEEKNDKTSIITEKQEAESEITKKDSVSSEVAEKDSELTNRNDDVTQKDLEDHHVVEKNDEVNDAAEKNDQIDSNLNNLIAENNEENKEVEKNEQNVSQNDSSNGVCVEQEKNSGDINKIGSNDDISVNNDILLNIEAKGTVNNGSINNLSENNITSELCNEKEEKSNNISSLNNNDNQNLDDNEVDEDLSSKHDDKSDLLDSKDLDSQDSNSISTLHESLLNDNTQSNDEIDINGERINEKGSNHENNDSQTDDLSMENLSQDSKISDNTVRDEEKSVGSQDEKVRDDSSVKKSSEDDMDDSKLMAALDAQIGESNDSSQISEKNVQENDKIALEDLISSKNNERNIELDIIPDEFNFDN